MQVVLLERIERLGQMGDVVKVKTGFARNYLLPQKKALRATEANMALFETQRTQLEAHNLERRTEAEAVASKMEGERVIVVRQASETDQLYGSVSARDIATALSEDGFSVGPSQVTLDRPIKTTGIHPVNVKLHPEVAVTVTVNVARTAEEAERQTTDDEDQVRAEAEAVFETAELAEQAVEDLVESDEPEAEAATNAPEDSGDAEEPAEEEDKN